MIEIPGEARTAASQTLPEKQVLQAKEAQLPDRAAAVRLYVLMYVTAELREAAAAIHPDAILLPEEGKSNQPNPTACIHENAHSVTTAQNGRFL